MEDDIVLPSIDRNRNNFESLTKITTNRGKIVRGSLNKKPIKKPVLNDDLNLLMIGGISPKKNK